MLAVLATASTTYAIVLSKPKNVQVLPDTNVQMLQNAQLSSWGKDVVKFVDGTTTCYILSSVDYPRNGYSISCVK